MHKVIFSSLLLLATSTVRASDIHWGYSGHEGPEFWGKLSDKYSLCSSGKNQSPIDITQPIEADLEPLRIGYKAAGNNVVNNGHTIKVDYAPGSLITVAGHTYELKQFHFHAPSENLIGSHSFPLEAHLVHVDGDGNLAVVGIMFEAGEENAELQKAWSVMPRAKNGSARPSSPLSAAALLPASRDYYRFNGSLTTPPCSEGVLWLVMKQPVEASAKQIKAFEKLMHQGNNRPVQATNARAVMQ